MGWFGSSEIKEEIPIEHEALQRQVPLLCAVAAKAPTEVGRHVFISADEGQVKFVACDGHRLLIFKYQTPAKLKQKFGLSLPVADFKTLAEGTGTGVIRFHGHNVEFRFSGSRHQFQASQLSDIPDFEKLIPDAVVTDPVVVDRERLCNLLLKFPEHLDATRKINLEVIAPKLAVTAPGDKLPVTKTVDILYRGVSENYSFNWDDFIFGVKDVASEIMIALEFSSPTRPCVIRGEDYTYLVLPAVA